MFDQISQCMQNGGVWDCLTNPFSYGFMQNGLIEVALVGIICGVVGCYVVLRGLAFLGDAFSHGILPGVVIAYLFGQSVFFGGLAAAVVIGIIIALLSQNRRISEDTSIGILFAGAFALGIVLLSSQRNYTASLTSILIGDVLGVSGSDILLTIIVGLIVVGAVVVFYKQFLLASFDRGMAQAMGFNVSLFDLGLIVLIALAVVVSVQALGNILVLAMLVTPAASARLLTNRLPVMMTLAAAFGALEGVVGLYLSFYIKVAAGGAIVLFSTIVFALILALSPTHGGIAWLRQRRARKNVVRAAVVAVRGMRRRVSDE